MGYWKTRVIPNLKKIFQKSGKKAAAAEASKAFETSKEELTKEFDEKKTELQPKIVEIYEASSVELKSVLKDPKEAGIKKHAAEVHTILEKLVAIDFPGSKVVYEASKEFGSGSVSGPVLFILEKVSTVLPEEVVVVEKEIAPAEVVEATTTTEEETPAATTTTIVAEREIVAVEEGSTEKELAVVADTKEEIKTPPPTTTPTPTPTITTPVEEVVAVIKTENPKPVEPVPVPITEPVKTPEVVAPAAPPADEPKKP